MERTLEGVLMTTLHDIVLSSPHGAKAIASKIGKPYSSLLRELNPLDQGAKLGVITFAQLVQTTGDPAPLRILAESCGFTLVPRQTPAHAD